MNTRTRRSIAVALVATAPAGPLACVNHTAGGSVSDSPDGSSADGTGATGTCPPAALLSDTLRVSLQFLDILTVGQMVCNYGPQPGTTTVTIIYRQTTAAAFAQEWAPAMQPDAQVPMMSLAGLGDQAVYATQNGPAGPGTELSVLKGMTEVQITAPTALAPVEALARQLIANL